MKKLFLILPVALFVFLNQPSMAHAWSINVGFGDHHDRAIVRLPAHATRVFVNGSTYYYSDGIYYGVTPRHEYVIVQPPVGVFVTRLPYGHQKIWINGRSYFRHQGTYYMRVRGGFEVIQPPVIVQPAPSVIRVR